ncbi:uncharacterized protein BJ212DRAFT_1370471 [Suillus subaureus]|uniref:Uncharacterized protein n=1 Tax=Suillus subaureus TaxID=48587 RepID=A0A9P7JB02_9AGAM|nr:uncharacterized protein BJ212DRAFT_1370471 [Suillus subaureus]KAG1812556.1 hypothetical protein BJ212DRAFT_1370471 [Suillus subaureus]
MVFVDLRHAIAHSTTGSHRKTCNALASRVRQCALYLFHAGASVWGDVYLSDSRSWVWCACYRMSHRKLCRAQISLSRTKTECAGRGE